MDLSIFKNNKNAQFTDRIPDLSQLTKREADEINEMGDAAVQAKKIELFGHDIIDVLPSEIAQLKGLVVWSRRELANYYNTAESLNKWAIMVDHKFAEIGWSVFIDPFEIAVDHNNNTILTPIIMVTGRMEDTDFEFDKAQFEVQDGQLDGIKGRITEDGVWREPKSVI
jgi:hypothetical protein